MLIICQKTDCYYNRRSEDGTDYCDADVITITGDVVCDEYDSVGANNAKNPAK